MPQSSYWLISLALFLLLGLAASLYIVKSRRPHEERSAGLRMLGSLAWTDFVQLVLAVLNGRGYERSFGGAGTDGEYLLERGGQKWLLSSRHSRAWKPGSTAIAEFAAHLRHQGLQGGVLAIPGRFQASAYTVAKAHRIELLDAPAMWDELQPAFSDAQLREIERAAQRRLRSQYALAWGGALVIAVLAGFALKTSQTPLVGGAEPPTGEPAHASPPVAASAAPTREGTATPGPLPPPIENLIPVEERRTQVAKAVEALPHVSGAHWPTPSTLQIQTDDASFDPHDICPLIEQDPELAASRLQVQYPPGSERPVRFLQCRAY